MAANALGTFDQLIHDIATASATVNEVAKESVDASFKTGVAKLNTKSSPTINKKQKPIISESTENADIDLEGKSIQEFLADTESDLSDSLVQLQDRSEEIFFIINELRESGQLSNARQLRFAYRSLLHAIEDVNDSCDLLNILLK